VVKDYGIFNEAAGFQRSCGLCNEAAGFGSRATLVIGVSLQSAIGAYSGARALAMILSTAVVTVGDASFE
jgi:hypothetical protein